MTPGGVSTSSLRGRLWKGWFCVALFIVSLCGANYVLSKGDKAFGHRDFGLDFIAFYRAGVLVRDGEYRQLYDLKATRDFDRELAQRENLPLGNTIGLFYNPPFFALVFAPLAGLGYFAALAVWSVFGLACFAVATWLIARMMGRSDWREWGLAPALMGISLPFVQTVLHAQNTFLSLLLVAMVVTAWRAGRVFWAGVACGVLFYKPQLAAVILAALIVTRGWRALLGAALSLGLLTLIGEIAMPGSLGEFLYRLGPNFSAMLSAHAYLWERHVTFRGFWQVLLGEFLPAGASSLAVSFAILCSVPVAILLMGCVWKNRKAESPDRVIAAVITAAPLIMPYYVDYDLLLLSIPAVLLAGELLRNASGSRRDIFLVRVWVGFFALLLVDPALTKLTHVNLSVPVLCVIAMMQILRALEAGSVEAAESETRDSVSRMAA